MNLFSHVVALLGLVAAVPKVLVPTLLPSEGNVVDIVYFDIGIGGREAGRIVMGLFSNEVPKTAKNFLTLCTNTEGAMYANSTFHRIIPNFMIQGGDFTNHDGTGGMSIYGKKFNDETFVYKHEKYCLSMANSGPNTNGSQFFITVAETSWLDGKHVVFGRVLKGIEVIAMMEATGSSGSGRTKEEVKILRAGSLEKTEL